MAGFRRTSSGVRHTVVLAAALTIGVGLVVALPTPAWAQATSPAPVCLAKTDATGGQMRFVVLEGDASIFEAAGFQRFTCPTLTPEIVQGQQDRCDRFRAKSQEERASLGALYGMAIDGMCAATDTWTQSQSGS